MHLAISAPVIGRSEFVKGLNIVPLSAIIAAASNASRTAASTAWITRTD